MSEDESSDQDDDWFESALQGDADEGEESAASTDEVVVDENETSPFGDESSDDSPFDDEDSGSDSPFDDEDSGSGSSFEEGDFGGGTEASPFDEGETTDDSFGGGDSPFDDDSAFGGEAESTTDTDESESGGLFEDDFSSAMESAGGAFGGGGGGAFGGGGEQFDDEDFESDIPRLDLGIEGLDNMIQGGVPRRHLMVAIGGPGTGKTTLGLQFLYHGLAEADDDAVFITLEQTYEDIMATADERDWDFESYENDGRLAVIDLDPVEMANSLDNIRGELPRLIEDFGADRFVLDSVSLLEMMYDDQAQRRTEVFDFTQSLKDAGVTTLFTSEAHDDNPYTSRHGIIEYLTDAVFVLRYVRGDATATRTAIEIQKIRNANHSRETKPYDITLDGIDVYEQADIF